MILSFKKKWKPEIMSGRKIHTIRQDKPDRWKEGNIIHFATGVRTKYYDNFLTDRCRSVQTIEIKYGPSEYLNDVQIFVDGILMTTEQMQQIAYNDGFFCLADFQMWFNYDFKGKIIHWTDFKYTDETQIEDYLYSPAVRIKADQI